MVGRRVFRTAVGCTALATLIFVGSAAAQHGGGGHGGGGHGGGGGYHGGGGGYHGGGSYHGGNYGGHAGGYYGHPGNHAASYSNHNQAHDGHSHDGHHDHHDGRHDHHNDFFFSFAFSPYFPNAYWYGPYSYYYPYADSYGAYADYGYGPHGGNYYAPDSGDYHYYYAPDAVEQPASPASPQDANTARIVAILPDPQAELFIDGEPTRQKGSERLFVTPALERGKEYHYTLRCTWPSNGQKAEKTMNITIRPGYQTVVNFMGEQPPPNAR
jgi:uncharacterized protein (TIGR03000 family)